MESHHWYQGCSSHTLSTRRELMLFTLKMCVTTWCCWCLGHKDWHPEDSNTGNTVYTTDKCVTYGHFWCHGCHSHILMTQTRITQCIPQTSVHHIAWCGLKVLSLRHYLQPQNWGSHTINCPEKGPSHPPAKKKKKKVRKRGEKKIGDDISLERMRPGHCQSDQLWNTCSTLGETSRDRVELIPAFSKHWDATINCTALITYR